MENQMNQSDHDMLIKLETRLDTFQTSHREFSGQILSEIGKVLSKIDQLKDMQQQQAGQISDLEKGQEDIRRELKDHDIRIATLDQQVESLQKIAETQTMISGALQKEAEKREKEAEKQYKRLAFLISVVTFGAAMLPKIWEWLRILITTLATNPVPLIQFMEVARYALGFYFGVFF
jgi:hypothetical protein